jgi:hypothetical protein
MALFVALVIAPVALLWHAFLPSSPPPPPGTSAPRPDQEVVQQFVALRQEHERAMRQFHEELAPAGVQAGVAVLAAMHPGKRYFQRLVELAEKHPEHPICPHIVGYALHCAGPDMTHEDHLRIKSILERHHRPRKPGFSP